MNIHKERPDDIKSIWEINSEAFETVDEANLVNALRDSGCPFISLVAEIEGKVVGHILFTSIELIGSENKLKLMGLAPMAVLSKYQNKGIGSKLVQAGIEHCQTLGCHAIAVLGHSHFYPKFGFIPSVKYNIRSDYEVPDEAFMLLELVPESLKNHEGVIKYHDAFNGL